ncbi:MAG: hypothetical protein COA47_03975 [Robiginitomaculum sp.]|nr:MAG: hypothetical protein COA47_03975 [Robiginitomaculum sp.]
MLRGSLQSHLSMRWVVKRTKRNTTNLIEEVQPAGASKHRQQDDDNPMITSTLYPETTHRG